MPFTSHLYIVSSKDENNIEIEMQFILSIKIPDSVSVLQQIVVAGQFICSCFSE